MLRKKILTGFSLVVLLFGTLLISCGTAKESADLEIEEAEETGAKNNGGMIKEPKLVSFEFNNLIPHCGGMAPRPGDVYPKKEPFAQQNWLIYSTNEDGTRNRVVGDVKSDNEGKVEYRLQPGKYQLMWPTKALKFEDFKKKESQDLGDHYEYGNEECFREWYNKADKVFEVVGDTKVILNYSHRCYTGRHPCLKYTGPFAP